MNYTSIDIKGKDIGVKENVIRESFFTLIKRGSTKNWGKVRGEKG